MTLYQFLSNSIACPFCSAPLAGSYYNGGINNCPNATTCPIQFRKYGGIGGAFYMATPNFVLWIYEDQSLVQPLPVNELKSFIFLFLSSDAISVQDLSSIAALTKKLNLLLTFQ